MQNKKQENVLIVFVKYPEPGKVKTRIARDLGTERAAKIYSHMARSIIEKVWRAETYRTVIYFDPPDRETDIRAWLGINNVSYEVQSPGTLGDKMSKAIETVFSEGAEKAVLIGTDVPEITAELIRTAFSMLESTEVVLGPTEDGGYYLIGLQMFEPQLFKNIDWSTDVVFNQSLGLIKEQNLSYRIIDSLKDVDTAEDVDPLLLEQLETENSFDS